MELFRTFQYGYPGHEYSGLSSDLNSVLKGIPQSELETSEAVGLNFQQYIKRSLIVTLSHILTIQWQNSFRRSIKGELQLFQ